MMPPVTPSQTLGRRRIELMHEIVQASQSYQARMRATRDAGKKAGSRRKKGGGDDMDLFRREAQAAITSGIGPRPFLTMEERIADSDAVNDLYYRWLRLTAIWSDLCQDEGLDSQRQYAGQLLEYASEVGAEDSVDALIAREVIGRG